MLATEGGVPPGTFSLLVFCRGFLGDTIVLSFPADTKPTFFVRPLFVPRFLRGGSVLSLSRLGGGPLFCILSTSYLVFYPALSLLSFFRRRT